MRIQGLTQLKAVDRVDAILAPPGAVEMLRNETEVLFGEHMRPLRADPSFIRLANRLGLVAAWDKSGTWPDFCSDVRLPYDCRAEARKLGSAAA
jgi:hypothetical protein